jgi:GNAT superfamily N-acetyltransferase
MLEVDDLISAADARSKGYGKQLLDWCYDLARRNGCSVVELDSAVHRADAHRFYFRERMHVLAFHFSRTVE